MHFMLLFFLFVLTVISINSMAIDGAGGKGTWGKLLDTDSNSPVDRNDPNYDSGEVMSISLMSGCLKYACTCLLTFVFLCKCAYHV